MASAEKYKKNQIGMLLQHNLREQKLDGSYYRHRNINIDPSMTHLNVDLLAGDGSNAHARLKKRLNEVYIYGKNGKHANDIVYMCEYIVTLPKDVHDEDVSKFFELANEFLIDRFGEKNVVSSVIHFDEVTPHLHFDFVPVVYDEKRKREKLCCKEVFTQENFNTFHDDLAWHMNLYLGYHCSILTGERSGKAKEERKKNLSVTELKEQSKERTKSLSLQVVEMQEQIKELELQQAEDEIKRKQQERYIMAEQLNNTQRVIDVNERNKILESENVELKKDNIVLRNENVELKKQADTLNILQDVFSVNVNNFANFIDKIMVDDNIKSMIRKAAEQFKDVIRYAHQYYQDNGYNR